MKTRAVVDRIEDENAILLVGDEQDRLIVPISDLPAGAKEGSWLEVDFADDRILSATLDLAATEAARQRIAEKLAKLRHGEGM